MIKTIIFDFGDVFLNLDKAGALRKILNLLKLEVLPEDLIAFNCLYEQGLINTEEFLDFYQNNLPIRRRMIYPNLIPHSKSEHFLPVPEAQASLDFL